VGLRASEATLSIQCVPGGYLRAAAAASQLGIDVLAKQSKRGPGYLWLRRPEDRAVSIIEKIQLAGRGAIGSCHGALLAT
jgi:hypothetical protein